MASNVTSEEARALARALGGEAGEARRAAHVEARQFDRPLRLSADDVDALRERLRKALPDVARELGAPMRGVPDVELLELSEVHAESVPQGLTAPFAALRFEVDKQPGWLVWDCAAALATLDVAMGAAEPGDGTARTFTSIERAMLPRVLAGALARLLKPLGLSASTLSVCQTLDTLGHWRQGGDKAEPQRLLLVLSVGGPGGESRWKLYLPGVVPSSSRSAPRNERPAPLPAHLGDVGVELRAHLGANEVPLAELLALEVGDVIPLRVSVGEPLAVLVEDQGCLRATLGRSQGKLALRISAVERPKSDA